MSFLIHTDVTAVKLHSKFIIAGIGSFAFIYLKHNFKLINKIQCLNGQKIYGFVPHEIRDCILVFGGKQFSVLSFNCYDNNETELKVVRNIEPVICNDWLHSGVWQADSSIAVLTAHNTVQIWDPWKKDKKCQYLSKENSILYSGLLLPLQDGILVFAGTVFSEVIVHIPTEEKPLHFLKGHRGVIFSISADLKKGIIVTTSDDRSVRIWDVTLTDLSANLQPNTTDYWKNVIITCKREVYGHTARVMRSSIANESIISVGEDSAICYWDYTGILQKKYWTHQNACIWSVDSDIKDVVTGGGDGAVIIHPLTTALYNGETEVSHFDFTPKKIAFTARKNVIILDDCDHLIHYVLNDRTETKYKLNHESTYKLFAMSSCKQLVAVGDMNGKLNVFAENCKDVPSLTCLLDTKVNFGKILSMHWAGNRHLVFCNEQGVITLVSSKNVSIETCGVFNLSPCKERWLTSAALDSSNNSLIVGDRCGNVHIYLQGNKNPFKTFSKVHGRYGPTSITIKNKGFITTGRDGTIKYFLFNKYNKASTKYMSSIDLEFQWVEKFINKDETIITGFQERTFVVYDVQNHNRVLEVACGGGHRSWDVVKYVAKVGDAYDEFIRVVFVKNSDVHSHIFQMSKIKSRNVINSSHSKEINCLKAFNNELDPKITFYATGGEDTTLRISTVDSELKFEDSFIFKNLSNVRTLKLAKHHDGILLISGGGRAQIYVRLINIVNDGDHLKVMAEELVDFMIKGTDKARKNNKTWRDCTIDFDPETRIMDLDIIKFDDDKLIIYAGCSDAYLRVFSYTNKEFSTICEVKHHKTCILKTVCVKVVERYILITCTTRGEVALWDVSSTLDGEIMPFFTTTSNKSGINSIDTRVLTDEEVLVATGGDDNAVVLTLFQLKSRNQACVKCSWSTDKYHCSQITGVRFVEEYLLTTSIDQRVTLSRWSVGDSDISCEFVTQLFSDIADIQGLDVLDNCSDWITVCVYGKGMEVLRVQIPNPR